MISLLRTTFNTLSHSAKAVQIRRNLLPPQRGRRKTFSKRYDPTFCWIKEGFDDNATPECDDFPFFSSSAPEMTGPTQRCCNLLQKERKHLSPRKGSDVGHLYIYLTNGFPYLSAAASDLCCPITPLHHEAKVF